MQTALLDSVRSGCRLVAEVAKHVHINHEHLASYAASLLSEVKAPTLSPDYHYLGQTEDTVAFIVTLDTINFGSGYFPRLRKRPGHSGYFTIATGLTDYFRAQGPLTAQRLSTLTSVDCAAIFAQDLNVVPVRELMELFAKALNDLGHYLLAHYNGQFSTLIASASGSAERLVALLTKMPYFTDVQHYGDRQVPFYKRAQLTAADLNLALNGVGLGYFSDLERLTIFADNLVPHVLRLDGVLQYIPELAAQIDAGELIPADSEPEVEIRACAVHAVELLVAELACRGQQVMAMELDYLLWNRGQQPYYKQTKPRHRTRTVYY